MKAFSTLIGIIFILAIMTTITISMSMTSILQLKSSFYTAEATLSRQSTEACMEEALRHLKDDLDYSGGLIVLNPERSCNSTVSGTDTQKSITVTLISEEYQKSITAEIQIYTAGAAKNLRITKWTE